MGRKEEEKNCHEGSIPLIGAKGSSGNQAGHALFFFCFFFCGDEAKPGVHPENVALCRSVFLHTLLIVQRCESVKHGNFATFLGDFQILFPALGTGGTRRWKLQIECQMQWICFWVEKKLNEWWKSFPHLVKNEWLRCRTSISLYLFWILKWGRSLFYTPLYQYFKASVLTFWMSACILSRSCLARLSVFWDNFILFISFKEMQILLFIWNRCARSHAGLCVQLFVSKIICTRIKGGGGSGLRSFRTNSRALFLQWS